MAFLFDRASQYMVDSLIEGGSIKLDERGLYLYCFVMFFEMLANLVTTVLIGIVFVGVLDFYHPDSFTCLIFDRRKSGCRGNADSLYILLFCW